jgi:hypothetical protein
VTYAVGAEAELGAVQSKATVRAAQAVDICRVPFRTRLGVSASDAREISRVVIARSHGQIAYYEREDDGKIAAWMLPGHDPQFGDISRGHRPFHAYVVRRVGGRWQIVDEHVMVGGDG